jgi:serine O-acetyltransferase
MREHLKKRDEIRSITEGILKTYGTLDPKLQHLELNPLPDKTSVINILDAILEVIYPGYFGAKHLEQSNIEYHLGDLLDSIYSRLCEEIYRSVRPECAHEDDPCKHCYEIAEDQTVALLHGIPALRRQLAEDVQASYDGDPAAKSTDEVIFRLPCDLCDQRVSHRSRTQQ